MPKLSPISWRKFVLKLKVHGFNGPYYSGKHPYMIRNDVSITIPNPHDGDISPDLLIRILKQARISRSDWLS
jgi:predicted RNA binding protein YcfA (HicA-like mRNA interferase family)